MATQLEMTLKTREKELEQKNKELHSSFIKVLDIVSQVLFGTLWVLRVGAVVGSFFWLGLYPAIATGVFIALTSGITWGQEEVAEIRGEHIKGECGRE